jgi:hypothetical protein
VSHVDLRRLCASGKVAALFDELGTWQAVAARLGVSETALRRARAFRALETFPAQEIHLPVTENTPNQESDIPIVWDVIEDEKTEPHRLDSFSSESANVDSFSSGIRPPVSFASGSAIYRNPFDEPQQSIRHLTKEDCPDGSLILWASDVHIPIHNEPVLRLMVECAERSGVNRVIAGGDILDFNCLSKHAKESRRTVEHATVLEEVEPGRWFLNWLATKQTDFLLGNHEDRLKRFVDENPAFHGTVASNFAHVVDLPAGINVLDGEVRLGNLSAFHGHNEFKSGTGGKYPAQRILDLFPDQSSIYGHLHRKGTAYRTTRDEYGVQRTRRAYGMGHLSWEHMHYGYVGRSPNWQTGFGMIRAWWEDDRPRWTVHQIEVLFDRNGRPTFEFEGQVYGRRMVAA